MDDRKIGSVQRVMIYKVGGKIAHAVVSFGGFGPRLGAGPMPANESRLHAQA
jgi:hypothetical protein